MVIYHILFLKRTGIANLAWDSPFSKDPLPVFVYTQKTWTIYIVYAYRGIAKRLCYFNE